MRLNKILSSAGVASRRAADELIRQGRVTLNGAIVAELGTKADPERDDIRVERGPRNAVKSGSDGTHDHVRDAHVVQRLDDRAQRRANLAGIGHALSNTLRARSSP